VFATNLHKICSVQDVFKQNKGYRPAGMKF